MERRSTSHDLVERLESILGENSLVIQRGVRLEIVPWVDDIVVSTRGNLPALIAKGLRRRASDLLEMAERVEEKLPAFKVAPALRLRKAGAA